MNVINFQLLVKYFVIKLFLIPICLSSLNYMIIYLCPWFLKIKRGLCVTICHASVSLSVMIHRNMLIIAMYIESNSGFCMNP